MCEQRPLATVLGSELDLRLFNYRETTPLRSGEVDDEPYGGGAGLVLRVDVVAAALDAVYGGVPDHRVVALTPQGRQLTQAVVEEGGAPLGRVRDVAHYPANDVLELDTGLDLPLVEACVREIDLAGGRILVTRGFAAPG